MQSGAASALVSMGMSCCDIVARTAGGRSTGPVEAHTPEPDAPAFRSGGKTASPPSSDAVGSPASSPHEGPAAASPSGLSERLFSTGSFWLPMTSSSCWGVLSKSASSSSSASFTLLPMALAGLFSVVSLFRAAGFFSTATGFFATANTASPSDAPPPSWRPAAGSAGIPVNRAMDAPGCAGSVGSAYFRPRGAMRTRTQRGREPTVTSERLSTAATEVAEMGYSPNMIDWMP